MSAGPPPSNLESVAASAADVHDAPDLRGGVAAEAESYDVAELGPDCPVVPLGSQGKICWYLDYRGGLFDLSSRCEKGELMMLFGSRMAFLEKTWPQWKKVGEEKTGEVDERNKPVMRAIYEEDGFKQTDAQKALILACAKLPFFDPANKVRGRGAHPGPNGEIVLHCGDQLLVGGRSGTRGQPIKSEWYKVGTHAGFIYPRGEALPHPDDAPADVNIAMEVLAKFETWNWKQGPIAAHLLLCQVGVMMVCGALRRRPHGWIVGPPGCGKSTLQKLILDLLGQWAVSTEDATEAGVRQLLDQDTLPVLFDEIEAEQENEDVVKKIIRLARLAYSEGSSALRGSTDHKHKKFAAASSFLFSSIHHHELPSQDRGRIVILHLAKFPPKTERFVQPSTVRQWGLAMRRRLVEQWGRFQATFDRYATEMMEQGYNPREQDTYATLLACGDLLLHNLAPPELAMAGRDDRVARKVRELAGVLDIAREESVDTTERCLGYLTSWRLPAKSGADQESVAWWIRKAVMAMAEVPGAVHHRNIDGAARAKLATHGLRLVHLEQGHEKGNGQGGLVEAYKAGAATWLVVANKTHAGAAELFGKSAWPNGLWRQPLSLVPGTWTSKKSRVGDAKQAHGCVLIPLGEVIDLEAAIADAEDARLQGELREAAAAERRFGAGGPEERG